MAAGPKSPTLKISTTVTVVDPVSPLSITTEKNITFKSTQCDNHAKKTESTEKQQAHKAAVATIKAAEANMKAAKIS